MSEMTIIQPTNLLRPGDLVETHGMRVRLGEVTVWHDPGTGEEVYRFNGTVENIDAMRAGEAAQGVPLGWLRTKRWDDMRGWVTDREDFWAIQGNHLAHWRVVLTNANVTTISNG